MTADEKKAAALLGLVAVAGGGYMFWRSEHGRRLRAALQARSTVYRPKSKPKRAPEVPKTEPKRLTPDLGALRPDVRSKVDRMLSGLKARGYSPEVFEVQRSAARGRWLKAAGRSQVGDRSLHVAPYGQVQAVDVIDGRRLHGYKIGWGASADSWGLSPAQERERKDAGMAFFRAMGEEARAAGLVWGGDWKSFRDYSHVQG